MAERAKHRQSWKFYEGVLTSAASAFKGDVACINTATGLVTVGGTAATLLPIGYFDETLVGDGTARVRVMLFREIWLDRFTSVGGGDAVAAADVGSFCYLAGVDSVTMATTGSIAGRVWLVDAAGVLVQMALDLGPQGIQGSPGV